jgi:YHS domain-containing protein
MNTINAVARPLTMTVALCAALAAAPGVCGQTGEGPGPAKLTVTVWSCPTHQKLSMPIRNVCPICGARPVRRELALKGGEYVGDPYPLDTCPVTGEQLGAEAPPIVMMHEGREIRLCSAACIKKFEDGAAEYIKQIDHKIIEQQLPRYPMRMCPVSGDPLGSKGKPVNYVHNNRLVRLCCSECVKAFKEDPGKYVGMLDEAVIAREKGRYPLSTCLISGQRLGSMGQPVDYVVANRLVRFCCAGCLTAFNRAPSAHLETLDKMWEKAGGAGPRRAGKGKDHGRERGR